MSLISDFAEVVGAGYRPGLIRLGREQLGLSISIPSFSLADTIPPQAIQAWDSRLLSSTRHLTLIISGIRGAYPVLRADGSMTSASIGPSKLIFRVGLTTRYKPDRELVLDLSRSFAFEVRQTAAKKESDDTISAAAEDNFEHSHSYAHDDTSAQKKIYREEETDDDDDEPGEDFSFSLSSSLEAVLNDRFLAILRLRLKYSLGWAGAEELLSRAERLQKKDEDVVQKCIMVGVISGSRVDECKDNLLYVFQDLQRADIEEKELETTNRLPHDPLLAADKDHHLNLPLLAFSYLLRRIAVRT